MDLFIVIAISIISIILFIVMPLLYVIIKSCYDLPFAYCYGKYLYSLISLVWLLKIIKVLSKNLRLVVMGFKNKPIKSRKLFDC